uniref:Uncharacterized protein n=1 Tax=Xiphophorus couchianus TaxID=32473 RepID=A0A3B5MF96_9TELE
MSESGSEGVLSRCFILFLLILSLRTAECRMTPPTRYQTNPPEQNRSDLLDVYLTGSGSGFQGLQKRSEPTYKELPVKRERQRKNEQVYQGLSSATRDTYDSLQMQPLPAR